MQKNSILYILKGHSVSEDDLKIFANKLKEKNFTTNDCDKLLLKMGYESVFSDDEDLNDDDFDGFTPYEKTKPKHHIDS